jgi:hypothetical protein
MAGATGNGSDFVVGQRRTASNPVPGKQQLQPYLNVHAVPKQVSGERRDGVVSFALDDAFSHERPPMLERVISLPFQDLLVEPHLRLRM